MNTRTTPARIGIALLITTLAGSTIASEPDSNDADLLKGPKVAQSSDSQSNDTMSGKEPDKKNAKKKAGELPFTAFTNAVDSLKRAAKDNPELALTDEQREEIESIVAAQRESMQAFMDEHRDELTELNRYSPASNQSRGDRARGEGKEARGARRAPPKKDGAEEGTIEHEMENRPALSRSEMRKNREKLAKLMELAPSDAESRKKIWAVLTPQQQDSVKETLTKVSEQRKRRASMMLGRSAKKSAPDAQQGQRKQKAQQGKQIKEEDAED